MRPKAEHPGPGSGVFDLWGVVEDDVWLIGMQRGVILMVGLCRIESCERYDFRDDRPREHFRFVELRDVGFRDPLLFFAVVEDG